MMMSSMYHPPHMPRFVGENSFGDVVGINERDRMHHFALPDSVITESIVPMYIATVIVPDYDCAII